MNIREALKELKEICEGKFCNVQENITYSPQNETEIAECAIYSEDFGHIYAPSWILALAKMEEKYRSSKCPECSSVVTGSLCICKEPGVV